MNHYMLNLFGPALLAEFGWTKAQFALVGSLSLISLFFVPLAGRYSDHFGPKVAAITGFSVVPLCFLAFSMMTGSIYQFYGITLIKGIFGVLTTTLVFSRIIIERFDLARGMALSLLMSGPPLIGAAVVPIIGGIIEQEGWRVAYRVLALLSALGGIIAITLIHKHDKRKAASNAQATDELEANKKSKHNSMTWVEFMSLVRNPIFLLLIIGMFLCNLPQILVVSQLNLLLIDNGSTAQFATWLVSFYATTVVVGRFICGLALDKIPAHVIALMALGLPAIGYFALATPNDASWLLVIAVGLIGLAQGAEGDVGAYLTSRKFDIRHYSFIYSFLITSIAAASSIGSIILSYTLHLTDSFNTFLWLSGIVTVAGALFFFLTGKITAPEPDGVPA